MNVSGQGAAGKEMTCCIHQGLFRPIAHPYYMSTLQKSLEITANNEIASKHTLRTVQYDCT